MDTREQFRLVALAPSGTRIGVSSAAAADLECLAEALHEARPGWQVRIDGCAVVFSREGKVVDFSRTGSRSTDAV
jgi:hypothetical protein